MLLNQSIFKNTQSRNYFQVRRNINADKIRQLEDTVEILNEQIESLKLMLCYKSHELEEMQKELNYTNHELYVVNELYAATSERLDIKEIKELTNNLLVSEKPINGVLIE